MKETVLVMVALVLGACTAAAQQEIVLRGTPSHGMLITGNARLDLLSGIGAMSLRDSVLRNAGGDVEGKKSALLAGVLSLAVPGAGEYYTKSYWKAGGFVLVEAGLWVVYAVYTSKGNNQTDLFQNYADDHWSVLRYAQWIQTNASKLNPDVTSFTGYLIPGTQNLPPWQQVDWSKLNDVENRIAQVTGNGFTHLLPHRPEQQYYELIGKYPQFASGWDDASYLQPGDILTSNVSQRFNDYSKMRGKANDYYNIATTGAAILVANHLISALDAAWSAARFNNQLKLEAHLQPIVRSADFVEFVPTVRLTVQF